MYTYLMYDIPGIRTEESRLRQKRIAQVNESGASYLTYVPDILCMSPSPPNDGGSRVDLRVQATLIVSWHLHASRL